MWNNEQLGRGKLNMKKLLVSLCTGASLGLAAIAGSTVVFTSEANAVPLSAANARLLLKTAGHYQDARYIPTEQQRNGTVVLQSPILGTDLAHYCSGTVVSPTQIVTAAHCVESQDPRSPDYGLTGTTRVYLGGLGGQMITAASYEIHPFYFDPEIGTPKLGAFAAGDIAIVTLSEPVPAGTKIYGLYNGDPIGKVATHISYGTTGNGDGTEESFTPEDSLTRGRIGQNLYEIDLYNAFEFGLEGAHLIYDFDDGTPEHNALAWWLSPLERSLGGGLYEVIVDQSLAPDLGFGLDEVMMAHNDSGGGAFIDGLLAGVHSFGISLAEQWCDGDPRNGEYVNAPDMTCALDSSFGELAGDTSIAFFYDWLMARLIFPVEIPAPATLGLIGFGLLGLGLGRRRRA